jgi:hypothetical protein
MAKRADRGGAVGVVLLLAFLAAAVWVGFTVGRFYFDRSTIENEVAAIGDDALISRKLEVKERVVSLLSRYGATVDPATVVADVNPKGDRITIRFSYDRVADFYVTRVPLRFTVDVQREQAKAAGVVQSVQDAVEGSYNQSAQKYQDAIQKAEPVRPREEP